MPHHLHRARQPAESFSSGRTAIKCTRWQCLWGVRTKHSWKAELVVKFSCIHLTFHLHSLYKALCLCPTQHPLFFISSTPTPSFQHKTLFYRFWNFRRFSFRTFFFHMSYSKFCKSAFIPWCDRSSRYHTLKTGRNPPQDSDETIKPPKQSNPLSFQSIRHVYPTGIIQHICFHNHSFAQQVKTEKNPICYSDLQKHQHHCQELRQLHNSTQQNQDILPQSCWWEKTEDGCHLLSQKR